MNEAADLLASLVLEDGRPWCEAAYRWQLDDAAAVLDPDGPRRHYVLRGRGMSKSSDIAGIALALLLTQAPPRSRSYVYAADADQAGLLGDAMAGYVDRTGLHGAVDVEVRRLTARHSGASLSIESSDGASAYGTRPWLSVVDELGAWPGGQNHRRLWSAIISAVPKVPGSRLVVITTGGSPSSIGHEVWQAATASDLWRTSTTPGPAPWWTPDDMTAIEAELTAAEYRRLILCEWAEGDDALTTMEDVAACVTHPGPLDPAAGRSYCMALDIGTRKDRTALVVAHAETGDGGGRRIIIDRILRWQGTRTQPVSLGDVEAATLALWRTYHRPQLVYDLHQAAQLTERLRAAKVHCVEYTFSPAGVNKLARTLYTAVRDRALGLPDDQDLLDELATLRLVETNTPGLVRLDHHHGQHDDQAVSVAMACTHLLAQSPGSRLLINPETYARRLDRPIMPPVPGGMIEHYTLPGGYRRPPASGVEPAQTPEQALAARRKAARNRWTGPGTSINPQITGHHHWGRR